MVPLRLAPGRYADSMPYSDPASTATPARCAHWPLGLWRNLAEKVSAIITL